jgi:short-subunit dehydrogenase
VPGGRSASVVKTRRVAVVTGASSGIGAAIARRLAREGDLCVLLARREDRLRELAEELGGECGLCDVSDRSSVERAAAAVLERHPQIGVLVNNAGIPGRRSFLQLEPERIEEVLRTNYLGGLWCLRAFLPGLGPGSHVVNVVSVAGTVAFPPSGPYSASKHAQLAFSRATAAELAPRGVHVLTVLPGFVETEGFPQRAVLSSGFFRRAVIAPDEVAEKVVLALRRGRRELFVPRWYRTFALVQALAPGLLGRATARMAYRRRKRESAG